MGTSGRSRPVLVPAVYLLVLVISAKVYADDKCTAGCSGSSTPSPAFVDGTTYTYNFDSVVSVFLTSAEKQETSVKLAGTATVTALGNCAHVLRVLNLAVSGPDGKKYGKPIGIEKSVRFTLQDGQIGSSICTEAEDNQRSINIKRAIISLLQNAQKHNTEVDVFGVCPTDIEVSGGSDGVVNVRKNRNLNRCAHREQGKHDLLTSIYNPNAQVRSSHLLQSVLNVESKLKAGVTERVVATEEYLYRPFSVGQNGARAKVVTKLSLTGHAKGNEAAKPNVPKSIIFENPHPVATEHSNVANVLLSLKTAAQSLESNAGERSASIFAGLIKVLRVTNKADLLNVYTQIKSGGAVKDNNLARRVFLDALLRTGTGDSIEASIKLLRDNELNAFEQRIVFLSLTNVRHATSESLKAAASLLDQPNLPREVYLGVGALAGAYCREHSCHGAKTQSEGVAALSQKLGSKLQNCKPKTKKDEDVVIAVLKGIRNIRHIEDSLVDKLAQCVSDAAVKPRVQVAALEAYHADPCIPKLKKTALNTLKNTELDSEVRIKAYLALVDCPCPTVANELKTLLDKEEVIQVGRFIVSSLRAIKSSANPDRDAAKEHFGNIHVPNRFSVDDRRFSSFREFSYNIDSIGAGATYERSFIFSQDSFLPRSADLNLTAQIFGHNVNFLELGVRQGNLDRVLEHYLGPQGYLRNSDPQKVYDDTVQKIFAIADKFKERLNTQRSTRNVKQDVLAFTKTIKNELEGFSGNVELDIFVKLFGTDSVFLSLGDEHLSLATIVDKLFDHFDSGLEKAKQFTHEFRNHLLFLDAELAYPTAIGIPLKLNVQGASAVKLGFGGNIDLRRIIQDPNNAKIDIEIVPSANIELASYLYADADLITSGLKVFSTLHTSTGTHLVAKVLENGKGIDIQLGLPVEKQELLGVNHELVFTTSSKGQQETEVALKVEVDRKEFKGCFDQLSSFIGLTFCGDLDIPWVTQGPNAGQSLQKLATRFPYSGPAKLSVRLEKDDLKGFHFKGLLNDKDVSKRTLEVVFEAEGSKNSRRSSVLAELTNRDNEKGAKIEIKTPIKNADAHAQFLNNDNEKSLSLKVHYDAEEYFAKLGVASSGGAERKVYKPIIEYKNPRQQVKSFNVEGSVVVETVNGGKKYSFNGVNFNTGSEKITVEGFLAQGPAGFSTDLQVAQGKQHGSIKGKLNLIENGVKLNAEFHNTLNPNVDFLIQYEGVKKEGLVQNELVFVHGADSKSSSKKLTVKQNLKYHKKSPSDFDVITQNKVSYPELNLEISVEGEFNPKKVDIEFETKYGKSKAEFEIEARADTKKTGDYSVKFEGKVNENGVEFVSKRDIIDDDKSNWQNYLQVTPGGRYELNGVVNHRVKPNDVNVGVVGHLKVAGRNEDIKVDVGVITNTKLYNSHAKVTVGANDYLDYNLKWNKGANPTGNLKLLVKGVIKAQGQFKHNKADGKGNGVVIVEFVRVARKVKVDSNFLCHEQQHNFNVDIFLDFEKDNNNKIQFNTVTKAEDVRNFDSKNSIVFGGKKTEVHLKSKHTGPWEDREDLQSAEVVLPSGRVLLFQLDRTFNTKEKDHVHGQYLILVSDAKQRGGETSKLQYVGKLTDLNTRAYTFTHDGRLTVALSNGKNLEVLGHTEYLPKGDRRTFDYKLDVTGNILPNVLSVVVSSDAKIDLEKGSDRNCRFKASYGGDLGIDGNSKFAIKKNADGSRRYDADLEGSVLLPFEKAHDIKFKLSEGITVPKNSEGVFEELSTASLQVNADAYKWESLVKLGRDLKEVNVKVLVPHHEPFSIESRLQRQTEGESFKGNSLLKVVYGQNKQILFTNEVTKQGEHEYTGKTHLSLPEGSKVRDIVVDGKHLHHNADEHKTISTVTVDGKTWTIENTLGAVKNAPSFELKVTRPDKTVSRIYAQVNILNEKNINGKLKLENVKEVNLDSAVDVTIASADDFVIKFDIDSDKLKLKKVHVEASTTPDPKGKRIQLVVTSDGQNLLSGSTSYLKKQEGSKTIIEGSGNVKVKNEEKTASFKYIRELVNEPTEQGSEVLIKVEIGQKSFVVEHKITNVEYKLNNVYCEEKQQCANAEISAKLIKHGNDRIEHNVHVLIDLRKLGISPEFGLESNADIQKDKLPVLTFDIHLNQDKSKYHLHAYSQPTKGSYPAGITLSLPQRVISLERTLTYTDGKPLLLPIKGEIVLFLNKKSEPGQKSSLKFDADVKREEGKNILAVGDVTFSHPALGKDLQITGKSVYDLNTHALDSSLILDIFKKKNQRVTISGKFIANHVQSQSVNITTEFDISGKGLGIELSAFQHLAVSANHIGAGLNLALTQDKQKREAGVLFHASPKDVRLQIRAPSVTIINIDGQIDVNPEEQVADLTVTLLQDKPVFLHVGVKKFESFEISTGYKNAPENKLSLTGLHNPYVRLELKAEIVKGNEKKDLAHAAIFIQDDAPKSDFGVSSENIKTYVEHLKSDVKALLDRSKQVSGQLSTQTQKDAQRTGQILKGAVPDFKNIGQYYNNELDKIKNELINDKTLQEINQFVKNFVQTVAKIFSDIVTNVTAIIDQTSKFIVELYEKVTNVIKQNVAPRIKSLVDSLSGTVTDGAKALIDFVAQYIVLVTEFLEKHKEQFKELTQVINDLSRDITKLVGKRLAEIRKDVNALFEKLKEQIKSLPVIQMLKEKWQEFTLPEHFVSALNNANEALKSVLPTEELKALADSIYNYLTKKIKKEQVNDAQELQGIYQKLVTAIKSLAEQFKGHVGDYNLGSFASLNIFPVSWLSTSASPYLPQNGAASFSIINYLKGELGGYRERTKELQAIARPGLGLIPPFRGQAIITDGGHIFTFDGEHLTFPGSCKYVLSHDSVDGNFTVAATLNNGVIKSIILVDKSGTIAEAKDNGQLWLNNANHGYPVDSKSLDAWRDWQGINIQSDYGVKIRCLPNLKVCQVEVSGFYFGRTRGLLGDLNNEPYDDFKIPNGKVAKSGSEFGNAYRVTASCPAAKSVDHPADHHTSPVCDQILNGELTFKACRYTVNLDNYKLACQHAVLAHPDRAEEEACRIAFAYAIACRKSGLLEFVRVPSKCAVCRDGKDTYQVGQSFDVQLPQKQADIIVAVEISKSNEQSYKDLVVPLVSALVDELKSKKIDDIKIKLVGISNKLPYSILYDTDNNKLKGAKIHFTESKRTEPWKVPVVTKIEKVDNVLSKITDSLQKFGLATSITNTAAGIRGLFDIPLRPHAVKAILLVHGDECPPFSLGKLPLNVELLSRLYLHGISLHTFTPLPEFELPGVDAKQLVGVNNNNAILLSGKKPLGSIRNPIGADTICQTLTTSSSVNNLFSLNSFPGLGAPQKKQYVQQASHAVVESLLSKELHTECTCELRNQVTPDIDCHISLAQRA